MKVFAPPPTDASQPILILTGLKNLTWERELGNRCDIPAAASVTGAECFEEHWLLWHPKTKASGKQNQICGFISSSPKGPHRGSLTPLPLVRKHYHRYTRHPGRPNFYKKTA